MLGFQKWKTLHKTRKNRIFRDHIHRKEFMYYCGKKDYAVTIVYICIHVHIIHFFGLNFGGLSC
jgi:hypothetical protein